GEGQGPPATNKSATGRTVSEAQTRLQKMLSRQLFWAQNAVILIGEDLAREGVADVLDFFTRSTQPRLNTALAVAVGRAKDVRSGEGQGPPATNKSATGRTVSEAQTRLQKMLSRQLFWAQNAVILIGEDLAREGVADVLDFFTRSTQPRLNTALAVAVGRAKDV